MAARQENKTYFLPGDPSRTPLTHEEFKSIMRPFWKQRKQLQRISECNAPTWHVCMCDCADCPYRRCGDTIPMDTLESIGEEAADSYCMEDDVANQIFEQQIGKDDPHFGLSIGKFYISGFTGVTSEDGEHFIFLKTVSDNVELHFELAQDIDMIGGDTTVTINQDNGGYDRQFGISPTDFGRGTLIVRFTDYQNNTGEPQVYTDYLAAKSTGTADTVISLNEEGDYEVALDYEIRKDSRILGTAATTSSFTNYRIHFTFSVRNGNCMVFPFDITTGEELTNTAITPNGFRLDLARSRFLTINVKLSTLTQGTSGIVEDVRFNRPARDGEEYTREGIYTITVQNKYTGQGTVKTLYVGSDDQLIEYVTQGYTLDQIIQVMNR